MNASEAAIRRINGSPSFPTVVCFAQEGTSHQDLELFFGPIGENQDIRVFPANALMAHLLSDAGVFPSVGEARRNGWNIPIPSGFREFTVGKRRARIFTLKIEEERAR